MPASTRRAPRGAVLLTPRPTDPAPRCATLEQAIRMVRILGSIEARDWPQHQRKATAEAVADWLGEHAEHVERIERGCQRLLLQAAEMAGR